MAIHDLEIKVVAQKGVCPVGYKTGDSFIIKEGLTPAGLCMTALAALMPGIHVLLVGGSFPWEKDPDATRRACQDFENTVLFEIRRR